MRSSPLTAHALLTTGRVHLTAVCSGLCVLWTIGAALPAPIAQFSSSAPFESVALHCGMVACGAQDGKIAFAAAPRACSVQGDCSVQGSPASNSATGNDVAGDSVARSVASASGGNAAGEARPVRVDCSASLPLLEGVTSLRGHTDWVTHVQLLPEASLPAARPAALPSPSLPDAGCHVPTDGTGSPAAGSGHAGSGGESGGSSNGSDSAGSGSDSVGALERHATAVAEDAARRAGARGPISRVELLISASRDHTVRVGCGHAPRATDPYTFD